MRTDNDSFLSDLIIEIWQANPEAQLTSEKLINRVAEHSDSAGKVITALVKKKLIEYDMTTKPPSYSLTAIVKKQLLENL